MCNFRINNEKENEKKMNLNLIQYNQNLIY